jgi:ABC-type branched-subunit amino acid transport system substrate-binding protein
MCQECQQVVEQLNINVDLFFEDLNRISEKLGFTKLEELDKKIICQSLLGHSPQEIANLLANFPYQTIRDRLSKRIYGAIAELMQVEQKQIARNWTRIINFILNPHNGYKLNPAPQLNSDNFQGSFGRQIFLYPPNQEIVQFQIKGTQLYQRGLYYQALLCFLEAWEQEKKIYGRGNPEVLIYINNCLLEYKQARLQERNIKTYTLAVVAPFHHNQGHVANEILRGVAQIQLQINLQSFDMNYLKRQGILDTVLPNPFFPLSRMDNRIALRILIVNDPNNLYDPYNQTAENLANLAPQLNLIAVLGHYSSEMTKKALSFYSRNGLILINSSSTSNELSHLSVDKSSSFFRLTTQDSVNAAQLIRYLAETGSAASPKKVAIIYNKNSSYSTSYKTTIKKHLDRHSEQFVTLKECDYISEHYYQVKDYLENIRQEGVDIIIIVPDGGIEPNSLNNAALISRLNLKNCLVAGSATFYQENVLHWIHEQSQYSSINPDECRIIACIPWHWNSERNGCNSSNLLAQHFCKLGTQLWGDENLTWRSATAFDSVLILLRVLEQHHSQDNQPLLNSQSLLERMDLYFKRQGRVEAGVTGNIEFDRSGDRIEPPAEIVAVKWSAQQQKWKWTPLGTYASNLYVR